MEYISVKEWAAKHGVSERTARNYCAHGRLEGAFLVGKTWSIPADAEITRRNKKKDKEFLGYVYDQTLEGTDIYICETTGLKINDKILNNTVSESMNAFKEANSANQATSNIRYAKDFSKKVSKLYKVTPGTKIPGVKISAISDIIDFVYIKRDEKVAYQQFYKAATRYQTLKKKTFSSCFELCVAMGEYAKVFLKNDLGKGIVKFSTDYCISKCNKRHKTLD